MESENKTLQASILPVASFLLILWLIEIGERYFGFPLSNLGLYPGKISGLVGLVTAPLLHSDFEHLFSNTFPILFLGSGLFYFYPKSSKAVIPVLWILPGLLTWFMGRPSYHIGASGIIYGLVSFMFFSGVIRKDKRSITLALLVTFLYGGIIWGILPIEEGVSWEYHFFGAVSGVFMAVLMRKNDPYTGYDWEDDDDEDDVPPEKLEIDWTKEPPF